VTATADAPLRRPPLRRRVDRRLVAGVVGGVADSLNAPAGFLRVLLVFVSGLTPWCVAAYAAAALVIPARGRNRPDWDNLVGLGRLAALWGGAAVLVGQVDVDRLPPPSIWVPVTGLGLAGLCVLLVRNYPKGPSVADARAAVIGALPVAAFAVIVAAGMVAAPQVRWDRALPAGVILAGVLLLVAARTRRSRFLLAPAVVATAIVAVFVAADVRLQGGVGDRVVTVTSADASPPAERVAVGDLTARLGSLPAQRSGIVTFRASVGVGDMLVVVPRRARVWLDGRVGRGTILAAGVSSGYALEQHTRDTDVSPLGGGGDITGRLTVHVIADVGLGELEVLRVGARPGL
jgi:phage shock protein PspC (stress-responsive transcriptional regulator)